MSKNKKKKEKIIEGLEIVDFASEGKSIGKHEGKVIFVPFTAPGDVVDVRVLKDRRNHTEATVVQFQKRSSLRTDPACKHFQTCGGCKWQHVPYSEQIKFKEIQVKEVSQQNGIYFFS
jgi:23S rRNA (uracil1939-C5)-methyltransferase